MSLTQSYIGGASVASEATYDNIDPSTGRALGAVATGNAVILKPADERPRTAVMVAELAVEAGIPPGVLNVVTGIGVEAGAALAATLTSGPAPTSPRRSSTTSTPRRTSRSIEAGQVYVNTYGAGGGVELPFGGFKKSGYGREKGYEALDSCTQTKTVVVRL